MQVIVMTSRLMNTAAEEPLCVRNGYVGSVIITPDGVKLPYRLAIIRPEITRLSKADGVGEP